MSVSAPDEIHFVMGAPCCEEQDHPHSRECSYRVEWTINPHMVPGTVDPRSAATQHARLVSALRRSGARVTLVPFVHGAYDSVFTKDCAIVSGSSEPRALLASPLHPVRQAEQVWRANHLRDAGFDVSPALPTALEGGDVLVLRHLPAALMGHGFRTDPDSAKELGRFLRTPVVSLELRDPSLFHLDTALSVLADGTALVCEEAFTPDALKKLHALPLAGLIPVAHEEAQRFATNVVEVGDTVVTGSWAPQLARRLIERGKHVVYTQLDQFHNAGGSAACLVATHRKALRPPRRAVA